MNLTKLLMAFLLSSSLVVGARDCDNDDDPPPPECSAGATRACPGNSSVGACEAGTQTCSAAGSWGACVGQVSPAAETCDGVDNDCDGTVDEALTRSCYDGPAATAGVGACAEGVSTCSAGAWSACAGDVLPAAETCDGVDNDCDGTVDESLQRACYDGPAGTVGVGVCAQGVSVCSAGGWSGCMGDVLPSAETCDGVDNDCDGAVDESLQRACYDGPAGTVGVGACAYGLSVCSGGSWGSCVDDVLPSAETCDGVDNDCDGTVDEQLQRACYEGPAGTSGVGVCAPGVSTCSAGHWGSCAGDVLPSGETCDGADNDCDGAVDEQLQRACYAGPAGTLGVGVCEPGLQTCSAGSWGSCDGDVLPSAEVCDNQDNDCDGVVDDALTRSCYDGPAGTAGVGVCAEGTSTCSAGHWGSCAGDVLPSPETCDAQDNDCDGAVDESLTRTCYDGPAGTAGVGICAQGNSTCSAGVWGSCEGDVLPSAETCDATDNDCDGAVDEDLTRSCYDGPAGTAGVGVCAQGTSTCSVGAWGACEGDVLPGAESCDALDNDCDGVVDEALTHACYTGDPATREIGRCQDGVETCAAGDWGTCAGEVLPAAETCNAIDDDCDGVVDEALVTACYEGPAGTEGVGLCVGGEATCSDGAWGDCVGQVLPVADELCDDLDDDCDGSIDEDFPIGDACLVDEGPCGIGADECSGIAEPATVCSTELGGSVFRGAALECGDTLVASTAGTENLSQLYAACTGRILWPGPEAVFAFVATQDRQITVSLTELTDDVDLLVLAGDCLGLSCSRYSSGFRTADEEIDLSVVAGQTYYFVADSRTEGLEASFRITVDCP